MCAVHPESNTAPPGARVGPERGLGPCGLYGNVLGVRVSALDRTATVRRIRGAIAAGTRGYVCVSGVHGVIECQDDAALMAIHNAAFLTVPDGMPLVWALKRAGHAGAGRVYGPDLMLALVAAGVDDGIGHFLYGTTTDVLERLESALGRRVPGVRICGRHAPPFRPLSAREQAEVAAEINLSGADIVWVGLSTPKQERWMAAMRDQLDAPMLIGVGAAFDFHAGLKPLAPGWMQRNGLEWAFRLGSEPRRLWRRYARIVPRYLILRTLQRLGLRIQDIAPPPMGSDRRQEAAE